MQPHDHYPHVLQAPLDLSAIAVGCYGCRTVVFYKHVETAEMARVWHMEVCSAPNPFIIPIFSPAGVSAT